MPLLRRSPLVTTTVNLLPAGRVAVSVVAAPSRWPSREGSDRLVVPLGFAALALARAEQSVFERVQSRLRHAASAVAEAASQDPERLVVEVSGFVLDEASEPGEPRVVVHLVRSAVGPVPKPARRAPGPVALAAAGTAVLGCCLAPMGRDVRLSAALALEGLLGWYRAADPHLQPPQQAIAYALRHAGARLEEEGRPPPAALSAAIEEHRKIAPMAGGA